MPDVTLYRYFDGSGNAYLITSDTIEYVPVTPEKSSSLFYHGGAPASVKLSPEEFQTIAKLLETNILNTGIHTDKRVMMSGVIIRESAQENREVILRPGSREILAIEIELNNIVRKK